jgi:hypothetical protein
MDIWLADWPWWFAALMIFIAYWIGLYIGYEKGFKIGMEERR